jgi:ribulose 1,5-bisphosphate carboxylase large subunit-like protein
MTVGEVATMASKTELKARLNFWQRSLEKLQTAYLELIDGGVKSYTIDDRQYTSFDLSALEQRIEEAEDKVDELTAQLAGNRPRKAFGIVPRDW